MDEEKQKKLRERAERMVEEMQRRYDEDGGENGHFTKLWKKLGDCPENNLKRFKFRKDVLIPYLESAQQTRYYIKKAGAANLIVDKEGGWMLQFFERDESVSAILKDLTEPPKNHQNWWRDCLIE